MYNVYPVPRLFTYQASSPSSPRSSTAEEWDIINFHKIRSNDQQKLQLVDIENYFKVREHFSAPLLGMPAPALDLLDGMLALDPAKRWEILWETWYVKFCLHMNLVKIARLSAKEALEGEWLRNVDPTGWVTQILSFGTQQCICILFASQARFPRWTTSAPRLPRVVEQKEKTSSRTRS